MTLIYFILILGVTIFIHELGHFIFAKRAGIYVYEFAIGMGPRLYSFKRKNDETRYSIRAIPLGGFVQMAGEEIVEDKNIPKEKRMQEKTWGQRFITIIAGALFNFILGIIIFFLMGLFYGAPELRPVMGDIVEGFPAYSHGVEKGDLILSVDGRKMKTWDEVLIFLQLNPEGKTLEFEIKKTNGEINLINIEPIAIEEKGTLVYKYGLKLTDQKNYGLITALRYSLIKFTTILKSMFVVIGSLITGALGVENLAGPVGIYNIVGEGVSNGFVNALYLVAFLSINVGFINLLPIPAFDGGRILFLIIEKLKGSKVNPKVENIIHGIGFALLILLMLMITIQDIKKLFM
jgi:regulator of sigma E protease